MTAPYTELLDSVVSYVYLSFCPGWQESRRARCLKVSLLSNEIESTKFLKKLAGNLWSGTSVTKVSSPRKLLMKENCASKSSCSMYRYSSSSVSSKSNQNSIWKCFNFGFLNSDNIEPESAQRCIPKVTKEVIWSSSRSGALRGIWYNCRLVRWIMLSEMCEGSLPTSSQITVNAVIRVESILFERTLLCLSGKIKDRWTYICGNLRPSRSWTIWMMLVRSTDCIFHWWSQM